VAKTDIITNIGQLAEGIGSYLGMMDGLEERQYVDLLLAKAFNKTQPVFNQFAVARAMNNKEQLGHMWRFGTVGITRGQARFVDGASQQARLWKAGLVGEGIQKTISYTFLPDNGVIPPLTEEETGVDQTVLNRLKVNTGAKEYRFKNRAFVFETGATVKLFPKGGSRLFIPIKQEGIPSGWKGNVDEARERGYVWAKTHTYSPGAFADSKGAFTGMFGAWWAGKGVEMMQEFMSAEVQSDLATVADGIGGNRRMTNVKRTNIEAMVKRGRKKTKKQFTLKVAQELDEKAKAVL